MENLATIADITSLQSNPEVNLRHHSTVGEYYDSVTHQEENVAGQHIDADREPYLVNLEAVEFSMHPFIAVHDVMIDTDGRGRVGLDTGRKVHYVNRNTLLAWRG